MSTAQIQKRLRISALLIALGLGVELISLFWSHPTAFLLFIGVGGLLIGLGIVVYLWSLLTHASPAETMITETGESDTLESVVNE